MIPLIADSFEQSVLGIWENNIILLSLSKSSDVILTAMIRFLCFFLSAPACVPKVANFLLLKS